MSEERLVDEAITELLDRFPPTTTPEVEFWGAQYDAGLAWVHFPQGLGGLGVSRSHMRTVLARLGSAGASFANINRNVIGYGMGAPTVLTHGTDEQRNRYLRPLFTAEEVWCQLFSEPGAGSDVAGLATRAVRDGDEWIVNGQKVWTTLAHTSKWGMLVARTDPDVPKHQGLTYFIVDMVQPGVEVRPLRQITGEAEFNEVYFSDARIPDANRLGALGEGWRVSITTLMNERVAIGSAPTPRGSGAIGEAVALWKSRGLSDQVKRDHLARLWIEAEALRLTNMRAAQAASRGVPGPEGSTGKLQWAELQKKIYEFSVDALGSEGMLAPSGFAMTRPEDAASGRRDTQKNFLRSRANSIEGGTSEVMRNILGERVLGLPGEPRVDKELPWRDVPR
jgi:alkylation response protein AidB-like acyl-CoA dehydrogenase